MEPSRKPSPLIRHGEAAELLTSRAVLLARQKAGLAQTMCETQEADCLQSNGCHGGSTAHSLWGISQRIAGMRGSTTANAGA